MPTSPCPKKRVPGCFAANSRSCFTCSADWMSLFGVKWSATRKTRSG